MFAPVRVFGRIRYCISERKIDPSLAFAKSIKRDNIYLYKLFQCDSVKTTSGKDADTAEHKPTDDHSVDTAPDQVNVDEIQIIPIQKSNEDHCVNKAYQVTDNADVLNNPNQEKFLDVSCVPHCKHHDKFHVSPTVKCCLCMKMMHIDCCNVSENEAQGYWTCLQCRSLPQLVLSIQQQVSTILKLLSEMDSQQPYNKLQQSICDISANLSPVEGLMENISSFQSSDHSTPIREGNQTGDSPSEYTSFKSMIDPSKTITPNLSSTEISFYGDSSIKEAETTHKQQSWQQNDRSRMKSNNERPVKITVLGDSITKHIKADSLADSLEAHVEKNSQVYTLDIASSLAPTIESDIVLLHIGTNHLKRETADVTIKKIRKLEDQLAANKKVKQVILSSIVHRDDCPRKRIHLVNTALEISAERQGWTYLSK